MSTQRIPGPQGATDPIDMNGNSIYGLPTPDGLDSTEAANAGYVDSKAATTLAAAQTYADTVDPGLLYALATGNAETDPGSGGFKTNNATIGSVTKLFISETDSGGAGQSAAIAFWDDLATVTPGGLLVRQRTDHTKWAAFWVSAANTDHGTWDTVNVQYKAGPGGFGAAAPLEVLFFLSPDAKTYIDAGDATALTSAKTYADSGDTTTLSTAETYADTLIEGVGEVFSLGYLFDSVVSPTAPTTPAAGKLRLNNADPTLATFIYLNETDRDAIARGPEIAVWDDTYATQPAVLTLRSKASEQNYVMYYVTAAYTDSGTYDRLPVVWKAGVGTFVDGEKIDIFFSPPSDVSVGYQPLKAVLTTLGNLVSVANLATVANYASISNLTTFVAYVSIANLTTLLGYVSIDNLTALVGLTGAANKLPYFTGSGALSNADFTAAGRALVDDADAPAQRTTLGVVIGTNVQAWDADLDAIATLTSAANKLPYATGAQTWALADLTAAGRALIDDADAPAQRTTLGLGTMAVEATATYATAASLTTEQTARKLGDGANQIFAAMVGANWTAVRSTKTTPTWGGLTCVGTSTTRICYLSTPVNVGNDSTITYGNVLGGYLTASGVGPALGFQLNGGTVFNGWCCDQAAMYRVTEAATVPSFAAITTAVAAFNATLSRSKIAIAAGATAATARNCTISYCTDGETAMLLDTVSAAPDAAAWGVTRISTNLGQTTVEAANVA